MKKIKRKQIIKVTTITLTVAVLSFATAYFFFPSLFFKANSGKGGAAAAEKFDTDRVNIVLLGFDRNDIRSRNSSVFRPDTIMIAALDFKGKEVSLLSIPRDSYVKIAGTDTYDKINHAYMYGYNAAEGEDKHQSGIDTTIRTIEDFLGGIPIHYYVTVDMESVVEVVDQVGGVYFDVKYPIRTHYGKGRLLVDKGYQLLNGKQFLCYVRDRSVGGDFGRASRQQEILIEAFKQLKQRGKLKDIPALYRSLQNNVETNLKVAQIAQLAVFGMQIKPDQINTHVFTGTCQYAPRNGIDICYVVINEQARVELIKEVFGVNVPLRPQITLPGRSQKPDPVPSPEPQPQTPSPQPFTELKPSQPESPPPPPPAENGEHIDDEDDPDNDEAVDDTGGEEEETNGGAGPTNQNN